MPLYKCMRCGLSTRIKTHMKTHVERKFRCKPILSDITFAGNSADILKLMICDDTCHFVNGTDLAQNSTDLAQNSTDLAQNSTDLAQIHLSPKFECEYCHKIYAHSRSCLRHTKSCKLKREQDSATQKTYELVDALNRQIAEQKEQIDKLMARCSTAPSINASNNVNMVININKNRLSYDNTDYSVLCDQDIRCAIEHACRCMQHIIPATHFNKKYPKNQNIYVSCLKSAVAMMFEGERWNAYAWSDIADRFVNDNITTLRDWLNNNEDPALRRKFQFFIDKREDDAKFFAALKRELKMILYNNRALVHSAEMRELLQTGEE